MSIQVLPQSGSISGRIGKGIGQGLSAALPKVVERKQLSEGLRDFEKNAQNLTPLEQYTRLASIPGITPSMLQALPEILKQQGQAKALTAGIGKNKNEGNKSESYSKPLEKFPENTKNKPVGEKPTKSITTTEPVQNTINPTIPKNYEQIIERGGELFNENPPLYKNDPQLAVQAAIQEDEALQRINTAQQNKRKAQQDVQSTLQNELLKASQKAGVKIPDNVYSEIEDEALESVNNGSLTELEAAKHYKQELDKISRQYEAARTIGTGSFFTRTPKGNKDALRSLREKFKERNDLENLVETYVSENDLSYPKASYLAYPVSENKELNNHIAKTKDISSETNLERRHPEFQEQAEENKVIKTMAQAAKIIPLIKPTDSFLSIAEELKSKGYDPTIAMDYFDKHRKKVKGLTAAQEREFNRPRDFTPSLSDLWMFTFSGLDKLVEQ